MPYANFGEKGVYESTIIYHKASPDGQIILPREVTERLGVNPGDDVVCILNGNKVTVMNAVNNISDMIATRNAMKQLWIDASSGRGKSQNASPSSDIRDIAKQLMIDSSENIILFLQKVEAYILNTPSIRVNMDDFKEVVDSSLEDLKNKQMKLLKENYCIYNNDEGYMVDNLSEDENEQLYFDHILVDDKDKRYEYVLNINLNMMKKRMLRIFMSVFNGLKEESIYKCSVCGVTFTKVSDFVIESRITFRSQSLHAPHG